MHHTLILTFLLYIQYKARIPTEAYIPDGYIADPRYKMELYRRFAEVEYSQRDDLMDEIIDRFGNPPEEVENLWRVASLRGLCRVMKIRGINVRVGEIRITCSEQSLILPEALMKLMNACKGKLTYKQGKEPQIIYRTVGLNIDALAWLEKHLPALASVEIN